MLSTMILVVANLLTRISLNRSSNEQALSQQSKSACPHCGDHDGDSSQFLSIMKARLPQYVFDCFVASGFDSKEANSFHGHHS